MLFLILPKTRSPTRLIYPLSNRTVRRHVWDTLINRELQITCFYEKPS